MPQRIQYCDVFHAGKYKSNLGENFPQPTQSVQPRVSPHSAEAAWLESSLQKDSL